MFGTAGTRPPHGHEKRFRLPGWPWLTVTYDTRTTFRRLRGRASLANARAFRRSYFGKTVRAEDGKRPLNWSTIPIDYDVRIRTVRQGLGMSQARFAEVVGAARKAVV